jgi:hypothetical protein
MAFEFNEDIRNAANNINTKAEVKWEFDVDVAFLALYTIEVVCKLAVHRLFYFWNVDFAWNWLDFFMVVQGLILEYIQFIQFDTTAMHGGVWMRMLRILKAVRFLRVLKAFSIFTQVHLILNAIIGSVMHLFWSIIVLTLLFFTFAMYFTSSAATYLETLVSVEGPTAQSLIQYFGSVDRAMLTLFMSVYDGMEWGDCYRTLLAIEDHSNAYYGFLFFISFVNIALLNIVLGMFVENALKIARPDIHQLAEERLIEERAYATELNMLFKLADKNSDGFADKEELEHMVRDGRIVNFLRYMNIDPVWSKHHLFSMFDEVAFHDGYDKVPIAALVERVMAVRGGAKCTDIMDLRETVWHVKSLQQQMMRKIDGMSSVSK